MSDRDNPLAYGHYPGYEEDQRGGVGDSARGLMKDAFGMLRNRHGSRPQSGSGQGPPQSWAEGPPGQSPSQGQQPYGSQSQTGSPAYQNPPYQSSSGGKSDKLSGFLGKFQDVVADIGSEVAEKIGTSLDPQAYAQYGNKPNAQNRFGSFAPQRRHNDVKWYVDGCGYMWAVSEALEHAKESIWILDWWLSPELYLRRPPAQNEQYRVDRMLLEAARRGVRVNIIVYKEVKQALTLSSEHTKKALEALHPNIAVFRHPDHAPDAHDLESAISSSLGDLSMNAPKLATLPDEQVKGLYGIRDDVILFWAHHEKLCLIDGKIAFMGGLDLCFGRWDTYQHAITDVHPTDLNEIVFPGQDYNNARVLDFENVAHWDQNQLDRKVTSRMGWSDISVCLRGPVVEDLRKHFVDRWNFIYDIKYVSQQNSRYLKLALYGRPSSSVGQQPVGPSPTTTGPTVASPLGSHPSQPAWSPQSSLSAPFGPTSQGVSGAGTAPPQPGGLSAPFAATSPGGQGGLSTPQPGWSSQSPVSGPAGNQAGSQSPLVPSPGGQYGPPKPYNNPYSGQQLPPPPPGAPRLPQPQQAESGYRPQNPQGAQGVQADYSPTPTHDPARPPPPKQAEPGYGPQSPQGDQGIQGDYSPTPAYTPSGPPPPQQAEPGYRPQNPQGAQGVQGDHSSTPTYTPQQAKPGYHPQGAQGVQGDYSSTPTYTPPGPPPPQQAEPGYRPQNPPGAQGIQGDYSSTPTYSPSGPPGPPPPQQAEPGYRPQNHQGAQGIQEHHTPTPAYNSPQHDQPPQHGQIPYFPPPPPGQDPYQQQTRGLSDYDHQDEGVRGLKDDFSNLRSQLAGQVHHYQDRLAGHRHQAQQAPQAQAGSGGGPGGMSCQIVRSCTKWSHGVPTEHSIADAYAAIIRDSHHFVYIENQFFITATSDAQKPVENRIGAAIVERILRAARAGQKYKIIVVIPSVPGFAGDLHDDSSLGTRAIMEFQYYSISRGGHSILELVAKEGYNPLDYIRFYNLRNYDRINVSRSLLQVEQRSGVDYEDARKQHDFAEVGTGGYGPGGPSSTTRGFDTNAPFREYQQAAQQISSSGSGNGRWDSVSECYMLDGEDIRNVPWDSDIPEIDAFVSEELYIHTKVLIADDRVVICGSANLNDRSQLGSHDSEIALIIEDFTPVESVMDGKPWTAGRFATSLRRELFKVHLGLVKPQDYKRHQANFDPVGVPNEYDLNSPESRVVADPLSDTFQSLWNSRARTNTDVFRQVFHVVPDDNIRNWASYKEFFEYYFRKVEGDFGRSQPPRYEWGHVVKDNFAPGPEGAKQVKELLSKVKGTLVEMPLMFLIEEDIAKTGLSLNSFTEPIYT
ncbi:hypothetical protein V8E54_003055 [Elaphomyces granulatus]